MQNAQPLIWLMRKSTNARSRLSKVLPAARENWVPALAAFGARAW
jgi:hypothetical protein